MKQNLRISTEGMKLTKHALVDKTCNCKLRNFSLVLLWKNANMLNRNLGVPERQMEYRRISCVIMVVTYEIFLYNKIYIMNNN